MSLPQAQLGYLPSINLGGYIPAPRKEESIWDKVLAQVVSSAVGGVVGNAVDNAMSQDYTPEVNELTGRDDKAPGFFGKMVKGPLNDRQQLGQARAQAADHEKQKIEIASRASERDHDREARREELAGVESRFGRQLEQQGQQFDRELKVREEDQILRQLSTMFQLDRDRQLLPLELADRQSTIDARVGAEGRADAAHPLQMAREQVMIDSVQGAEGRADDMHDLNRAQAASSVAATNAQAGVSTATTESIQKALETKELENQELRQRLEWMTRMLGGAVDGEPPVAPPQVTPQEASMPADGPGFISSALDVNGPIMRYTGPGALYHHVANPAYQKLMNWYNGDLTPAQSSPSLDAREAQNR